MSTLATFFPANPAPKFYCESCDYSTCRKSNYDEHLLTAKHKKSTFSNFCQPNFQQIQQSKFTCENCNKEYKYKSGLWRHNKKCKIEEKNNEPSDKELIVMLLKQNSQLIEQNNEMAKNSQTTNSHNNNNTHSHNKTFNLQFFLNETCKDAMNITDFVDSIKLQLSDLIKVGEIGYVEGISNIITKNLNALDVTQRPVHCTDKKRETIYIKDADKWEKDEDKSYMHKLIKRVVSKNMKMFPKYREKHPDCMTYHSKFGDQYQKIIYESMGGKGDNDFEKNEKIIKNVLKEVVVDKNI